MAAIERDELRDGGTPHTSLRIEDAAIELFYERGFKTTTMRDIAVACGLTPGAFYNHYASKDELLYTILKRVHEQLQEDILSGLEAAERDPRSQVRAYVYVHALYHTRFRTEARVANQEIGSLRGPQRDEIVEIRRSMRGLLKDLIRRGEDGGVFDAPDEGVMSSAILNMGISIADWFRPDGRLAAEEVADIHARLALRLLGDRG